MRLPLALFLVMLLTSISPLGFAADAPAVYEKNCASCHGADGHGRHSDALKAEIPDLRSKKVQDLTDEQLYDGIAKGTRHKEYAHGFLYRGLKEKDIRELVKYIRTLTPNTK